MCKLLKPNEVLENFPQIKKLWSTPQEIGYLLKLKLIKGKHARRTCYIDSTSVLDLFAFIESKNT